MLLDELKDVPCADCGGRFHAACMDFDHVGGDKAFTIGNAYGWKSLEKIRAEVAKCDIRCANCHRLRHWLENATSDVD